MSMTVHLTGDADNFRSAGDLTDATHDRILAILIEALDQQAGGSMAAALRALRMVEAEGYAAGWTDDSVRALTEVAARMYGELLAQNMVTLHRQHRRTR